MDMLKQRPVQIAVVAVIGLVVVTSLVTGLLTAKAARPDAVGYLRIQAVLNNWPSFVETNKQFNEYAEQLQADYKERLEKATDEEKESLLQEIQEKMQKTNDDMVEPYDEILERAIEDVRRHYGLNVVLSPEYVITGGVDVTEMVTSLVNEYSKALD